MELPDLSTLESRLPFDIGADPITASDNITGEIDPETKALIDKVNSAAPTNFDETEVRELQDHIEQRRELADKLEKDEKFKNEYIARQKLISDAKTIKDAAEVEKEFERFTNLRLADGTEPQDPVEFPEIPEVSTGTRHVINITNSHNITLHFH